MSNRVLFLLKKPQFSFGYSGSLTSGLGNSVRFVVDMLRHHGIDAQLAEVQDGDSVDREVARVHPTHVVIEAFWVTPAKFDQLLPLHPGVKWIVRNHSEVPFLCTEGIAFNWAYEYLKRGIELMCNSKRAVSDFTELAIAFGVRPNLISYGPNYYPLPIWEGPRRSDPEGVVAIGCFGAIRPLKNHVQQALAAISYAQDARLYLDFHINVSRLEGGGEPILKSLRAIFAATNGAELVEHSWLSHSDFRALASSMDLVMQVSFTETFNIVAADAVAERVPVVVSSEVSWLGDYARADPNSRPSIEAAIILAMSQDKHEREHRQLGDLVRYCLHSIAVWKEYLA